MAEDTFAFPLSFAQQRLWFLDQLAPGNAFYNIPAAFRLTFPLKVAVLERSLSELVRRHESLRTTFVPGDGAPSQVVGPPTAVTIPVIDLRALAPAEREAEALTLTREEARRPFDLARGPLFRSTLVQLGDQEFIVLLTLHHIVSDGWSMVVFSRELTALYTAFAMDLPSPLAELSVQYADFAVWQRSFLAGEHLARELAWWRQRLAGLSVLQLPTDRPRPPVATYEGAVQSLEVGAALCSALRALGQREGATLFMTLLAGFAALLHQYSGQEDVVVGAPTAGRNRSELEALIGFFVNSLVLRIDLAGDPSFRALLGRVRETTTDAYAHQDVPFEKLVEELQPDRDLSRNPLFQVTFQVFSNLGLPLAPAPGAAAKPGVERGAAVFDLAVNLWEAEDRLVGQVEYSTALFDAETIGRLAGHYLRLLEGAVAEPDRPVSRLSFLSQSEYQRVVVDWNRTSTDYPRDRCIHEEFQLRARQTPGRVAVECEGERLSYGELETQANRLAHVLLALGVGPESLVGVCLERSVNLVVTLLGILKAGGAYVPLDPTYPEERLAFMIADCSPAVVVTNDRLARLVEGTAARVFCWDREEDLRAIGAAAAAPVEPSVKRSPEMLAYVIYTSGSTGRPKGTAIPHRGVMRLVCNNRFFEWHGDEIVLQFAPISFDASTFEIWGPLLHGGRLSVFPPHTPSLEELGRFIASEGITTLWLTSSLFQQMVDGPIDSLAGVRDLLAGGDVLPVEHVRKWLLQFPGKRLINGYGPTENTTFTCCHTLSCPDDAGHSVPIGRPISNTRVYLLNRHLQPVPIGVAGELFTGGDGLARGYLNQPELTGDRFVRDPFSPDSAGRLYRTGDLARYRRDGVLEFLGRLDHQAKIRGYRIEPGEVETVLRRHPAVREAVVVLHRQPDGDKILVAYVVLGSESPIDPAGPEVETLLAEVRESARRHLPEFMVPSRWSALRELPLNPNGKVDRRALPDPGQAAPRRSVFVAPRTPVEERMAAMFVEVLQVDRVGVQDHFFADLGGHSLRATQVVSRVREAFGVDLPLRTIFEAPTVAGLSAIIEEQILQEVEALSEAEAEALLA